MEGRGKKEEREQEEEEEVKGEGRNDREVEGRKNGGRTTTTTTTGELAKCLDAQPLIAKRDESQTQPGTIPPGNNDDDDGLGMRDKINTIQVLVTRLVRATMEVSPVP